MTKENYGNIWVVDHIIPCAAFNLLKTQEQRRCFNYRNLQPLYKKENLEKGAIYDNTNISLEIELYFAVNSHKIIP